MSLKSRFIKVASSTDNPWIGVVEPSFNLKLYREHSHNREVRNLINSASDDWMLKQLEDLRDEIKRQPSLELFEASCFLARSFWNRLAGRITRNLTPDPNQKSFSKILAELAKTADKFLKYYEIDSEDYNKLKITRDKFSWRHYTLSAYPDNNDASPDEMRKARLEYEKRRDNWAVPLGYQNLEYGS